MTLFHKLCIAFIAVIALYFSSCQQAPKVNQKVELAKEFYKKLTGTIDGKINITMNLTKVDSSFNGNYYYHTVGKPIILMGNINKKDSIVLHEYDDRWEETGSFAGSFTSDSIFEGIWTNPKTKKSLAFILHAVNQDLADVSMKKYHKENCSPQKKNEDGDCSYIDVNLMIVNLTNANAAKLINQSIISAICTSVDSSYYDLESFVNSIDSVSDIEGIETTDFSCEVISNEAQVLCIQINGSSYAGGAHPNSWSNYSNYNTQTGKVINLDDILVPNFSEHLNPIAEKLFTQQNDTDGWDFEPGKFALNSNFAITPGGLLFMFGQYEIGSYAMGMPQVFISYKHIKQLLKKNSPITALIK